MKRHNFKGQGASHGNHKHHRAPGAIGSCAFPGRVFKGMKMSGHMGHEQVTTLNLEVVEADVERNVLLVKGSVPGPNGGVVIVRNAVKAASEGRPDAMAQITLKNAAGKDAGTVDLDDAVFGIQPNVPVMHQVVTAQLAARRAGTQSTKTRSRGARRRRQAVPPEGHRQRPPGLDPRAALQRRRRRARPQAAQVRPEDPEEDDQARAALGPVRPRQPRARSSSSTRGAGTRRGPRTPSPRSAALGVDGRVLVVVGRDDAPPRSASATSPRCS